MGRQNSRDAMAELDDETRRFMYDRMTDIGGLRDQPVDECVRELVTEMREEHPRDYDVPTQVLVEAAYDAAVVGVRTLKKSNGADVAAEVEDR
jgi:hypothetical protein